MRVLLIGTALVLATSSTVVAQAQPRTPDAALRALRSDRRPLPAALFAFQACPQQDPLGRAVFDAVRDAEVHGRDLSALAFMFIIKGYPDCSYAPLEDWLVEVVGRLHRNREEGALQDLARALGDDLTHIDGYYRTALVHPELQRALLLVAEDPEILGGVRAAAADAALRLRPPDVWIDEVIDALSRPIPRATKTRWVYTLGRRYGAAFFVPLAAAAADFTDDDLFTVSNAIGSDVMGNRVPPDEEGLEALRALVADRPALPSWAQIPQQPNPPRR